MYKLVFSRLDSVIMGLVITPNIKVKILSLNMFVIREKLFELLEDIAALAFENIILWLH